MKELEKALDKMVTEFIGDSVDNYRMANSEKQNVIYTSTVMAVNHLLPERSREYYRGMVYIMTRPYKL